MKIRVYNYIEDRIETVYESPKRPFTEYDRYFTIARVLRKKILKGDFLAELNREKLSKDDIENIRSVIENHPKDLSLNAMQMQWLNEYCNIQGVVSGMLNLPSELDTERARMYFAKAIKVGYMQKSDGGYKWLFGNDRGRKVSLGYFIQKVYCPNNTEEIPEKAVNQLFGVDRIGSAISQIQSAKKLQKWRKTIDNLFE